MIEFLENSPLTEPLIFDSHAHYDDKKFDFCRDTLLRDLSKHGVGGIITCGCDIATSEKALEIAGRFDYCYAAVGYHPENLERDLKLDKIEELAGRKKAVAIGEIGLDYYWDSQNRERQLDAFEQQLIMANRLKLPVIVHDRDAHADTLNMLLKHRPRGVVHCFSASPQIAAEILKIGMYIGVGGVITFKNARRLPEVVALLPPDRLLVETDCPYLSPEPYRGKLCHSGMIALTAQRIAEIRGTSCDLILKQSFLNAKKLFSIE